MATRSTSQNIRSRLLLEATFETENDLNEIFENLKKDYEEMRVKRTVKTQCYTCKSLFSFEENTEIENSIIEDVKLEKINGLATLVIQSKINYGTESNN